MRALRTSRMVVPAGDWVFPLKARYEHVQTEREPYDATKTAQARCFDALRMPFTVRPDIGAIVGVVGEPHHGKWTFDASGGVVAR